MQRDSPPGTQGRRPGRPEAGTLRAVSRKAQPFQHFFSTDFDKQITPGEACWNWHWPPPWHTCDGTRPNSLSNTPGTRASGTAYFQSTFVFRSPVCFLLCVSYALPPFHRSSSTVREFRDVVFEDVGFETNSWLTLNGGRCGDFTPKADMDQGLQTYVYVYIYIYIYVYVYMYIYIYIYIYMYMYVYIYIERERDLCVYAYITYVCVYIYIYDYYIYIYIYIYIHTRIWFQSHILKRHIPEHPRFPTDPGA